MTSKLALTDGVLQLFVTMLVCCLVNGLTRVDSEGLCRLGHASMRMKRERFLTRVVVGQPLSWF
jgi:hypothetical protein